MKLRSSRVRNFLHSITISSKASSHMMIEIKGCPPINSRAKSCRQRIERKLPMKNGSEDELSNVCASCFHDFQAGDNLTRPSLCFVFRMGLLLSNGNTWVIIRSGSKENSATDIAGRPQV